MKKNRHGMRTIAEKVFRKWCEKHGEPMNNFDHKVIRELKRIGVLAVVERVEGSGLWNLFSASSGKALGWFSYKTMTLKINNTTHTDVPLRKLPETIQKLMG